MEFLLSCRGPVLMRMLAQLNGLAPDCEIINDAVILFRGGCLKDLGHEIILFIHKRYYTWKKIECNLGILNII